MCLIIINRFKNVLITKLIVSLLVACKSPDGTAILWLCILANCENFTSRTTDQRLFIFSLESPYAT